jgi:hypothetical protein
LVGGLGSAWKRSWLHTCTLKTGENVTCLFNVFISGQNIVFRPTYLCSMYIHMYYVICTIESQIANSLQTRVTRCICERVAQNVSQSNFMW